MKIFKKFTAAFLVFSVLLSFASFSVSASTYRDVDDSSYYKEAVEALTTYGIVSGYAGYFEPNAHVTRAEFAKMVTLASGLGDDVYSNAGKRRFDDVALTHWANGYINTASENKLIVGYPNGQFMPDKKVTFAEAVTVLLRAMNYSTETLGDNWPYAYMVKARGLGITDGISLDDNDYIKRGDLALIINRALETKMNGSNEKLISKMEITITDELLVIATRNEDKSLASDEIKTDAGTYTLADINLKIDAMSRVKLVLDKDKKVINFTDSTTSERVLTTVDGVVNGETYFSNGTSTLSLGVSDNTSVYNDGSVTTYGNFKSHIEDGAAVSIIYDNSGAVRYLVFGNADYTEPVAIRTNIYTALGSVGVSDEEINSAKVIRNGYAATLSDVQTYDVAYYLADNSTIYLYSDKVSGVYREAYPSKSNVTSVEISGNILELETQSAAYKLGEKSGSYKIGSRVTALLGMDGKIVDVVDLGQGDMSNYGILLSYGTEISNEAFESGKEYKYITVINGEGTTNKYITTGDYSKRIGDVGKLSFDNDGNASFAPVSTLKTISGEIDRNNRKIGDFWLTNDCVIIERTYAPDSRTGTAVAQVIDLDDIIGTELKKSQVIHAVTSGDFGDIALLFVENITHDQYTYGILTSMSGNVSNTSSNASYTVYSAGQSKTYQTSFYNSITSGTPVALLLSGNSLVSLKRLSVVKTGASVKAIDATRVKIGDEIYPISDDVQIVKKGYSSYTSMSVFDIEELKGKTVNLYSDAAISAGGVIRVITVNN
ncbi:MAG: S-layer homology domain-containing protein [Clostridia bacterium]|nr:S-layer homology domain-containing protein [Clostridia bacterium]